MGIFGILFLSITPVYLSIKTLDFPCYAGLPLSSSELPDNIILLFQPPACPEVNPTERVWEYLKNFLAWSVFSNLDELRIKVQEILASFTPACDITSGCTGMI